MWFLLDTFSLTGNCCLRISLARGCIRTTVIFNSYPAFILFNNHFMNPVILLATKIGSGNALSMKYGGKESNSFCLLL